MDHDHIYPPFGKADPVTATRRPQDLLKSVRGLRPREAPAPALRPSHQTLAARPLTAGCSRVTLRCELSLKPSRVHSRGGVFSQAGVSHGFDSDARAPFISLPAHLA